MNKGLAVSRGGYCGLQKKKKGIKRKLRITTAQLNLRLPSFWVADLINIATLMTEDKAIPISLQDLVRIALVKTYYLSKNEHLPAYKNYKPKQIVKLPMI